MSADDRAMAELPRAIEDLRTALAQIDAVCQRITVAAEAMPDAGDMETVSGLVDEVNRRLRVFDPDVFLAQLDGRIEELTEQVGRLMVSASKVDEVLEASLRGGGERDVRSRLDALNGRLGLIVTVNAVAWVVVVVLLLAR